MKTIKNYKEKIKQLLEKKGYSNSQIDKIIDVVNDNISLSYFDEQLLSDLMINNTIKFLQRENAPKTLFKTLNFENKQILIDCYNKYGYLLIDNINLYRLLYNIAKDYDNNLLEYVYNNIFCDSINRNFIYDLNNSYQNNEDLYQKYKINKTKKLAK